MSELTKEVRLWSDAAMGQHDKNVLKLCDDHERLEAEHARVCNEHALLVQESGREGRELDRLKALLREWGVAIEAADHHAQVDAMIVLMTEAVRLAKEKEMSRPPPFQTERVAGKREEK